MSTDNRKILSGPRAIIKMGTKEIGRATGIQVDMAENRIPAEVLGNPFAESYVLSGVVVNFSIEALKMTVLDEDWVAKGMIPASVAETLLNWEEVTFTIVDKYNDGIVLFQLEQCSPVGYGFSVQARSIAQQNARWVACKLRMGSEL